MGSGLGLRVRVGLWGCVRGVGRVEEGVRGVEEGWEDGRAAVCK